MSLIGDELAKVQLTIKQPARKRVDSIVPAGIATALKSDNAPTICTDTWIRRPISAEEVD